MLRFIRAGRFLLVACFRRGCRYEAIGDEGLELHDIRADSAAAATSAFAIVEVAVVVHARFGDDAHAHRTLRAGTPARRRRLRNRR